jgi:hypothetical protein
LRALALPLLTSLALICGCGGGGGSNATTPPATQQPSGTIITPADPGGANVQFEVRSDQGRLAISRLIYGINTDDFSNPRIRNLTFNRGGGGNRITAYNWETNASNAGADYFHQNDGYLSASDVPGAAFTPIIQKTLDQGADFVMSIPMIGYVSADKNADGDVAKTPGYLDVRFNRSLPRKGAAFSTTPNLTDKRVYQDEFVAFLKSKFPDAFRQKRISFMLDNETEIWFHNHARLRGATSGEGLHTSYAELFQLTKDYASAIKDVAPNALIYGPSSYGWTGYTSLQEAPDANGRDFLDTYLAEMKSYETTNGRRILDVLDLHWYPEASSSKGDRITGKGADTDIAAARYQAPRSLYDPDYIENSWISKYALNNGAINLLPRIKAKIDRFYPGTKLSFGEYTYGGSGHISGGVAEADALGVFGKYGVFAANMFNQDADISFILGGMAMYRNFDGSGANFGDTSIKADTSENIGTAVYASVDSANANRMILVMINRSNSDMTTSTRIWHTVALKTARLYRLEGTISTPQDKGSLSVTGNALSLTLPAHSVTTVVLTP